jgi:heptosyltransferase-2
MALDASQMEKRAMKILVIQTAFIGDVVLTLPLIQEAKKHFKDCIVDVVTIPSTINVLENHTSISETIIFDKRKNDSGFLGLLRLAMTLRKKNYDVAFIPHRSLRSALLAALAQIPKRIGVSTSSGKFWFTNVVPYERNIHEIERNLTLLEQLGFSPTEKILPNLFPSERDKKIVDIFFSEKTISLEQKIIAIAPGSVWNTKRWLKENFISLSKKLVEENFSVIFVGGKNDEQLCTEIQNSVSSNNIFNSAGKFTLLQSAEIIRRCSVLVSNDSAPMHLAVAMRTPVVAIFGATIPEFGFAPYGEFDSVMEQKNLSCRPCGIHGGNVCPIHTLDCMKNISVEMVFDATITMLKKTVNKS